MTNPAFRPFHKIEVLFDPKTGAKKLLVDSEETWNVRDVSLTFTTDAFAEVTVTFYTDQVTVSEAKLPGHGSDA